ncbi:MAG TPA: urease accessory protein UreD [Methylomirabilota bacterium]
MTVDTSPRAVRVGRDGALRLHFERRGSETVVAGCRFTLPLQVLAPVALDDPAAVVSILNPTGGLVGGDRLAIDIHARAGAHAVLTTPSATRVYRAEGEPTVQTVRLSIGPHAIVEWVPDHTIPFAGSALRQAIDVELDETASLILVDAFAAGRVAAGEAWRFARLESAISVCDPNGWVLHDRFVLRGPAANEDVALDGLGFAESRPYFASIAIVGAFDRERFAVEVGSLGDPAVASTLGVAILPRRGALVRCLAPSAPALLDAIAGCWRLARRALLGLPPLALRKG